MNEDSRVDLDALWRDPSNWRWGVVYFCRQDPRTIVPKRYAWGGWTLNFGHPRAGWVGLATLLLAVGPTMVALLFTENRGVLVAVMAVSAAAVIGIAMREASRTS